MPLIFFSILYIVSKKINKLIPNDYIIKKNKSNCFEQGVRKKGKGN